MRRKDWKGIRLSCLSVVWTMSISLILMACSKGSMTDEKNLTGESNDINAVQKREWIYVPEVITVGDEHADYGRMQPVDDTFCYVRQAGESEDSEKSICRYSLTDRKLASVPIDWPEGGKNWDVGARFFDRDYNVYLTANVYPADYSSMTRFLCKFDQEGSCLFAKDITEQMGRDSFLNDMTVDNQGRIYIFANDGDILLYTGDGEYHGSVSCGSPEDSIQIKGACDGADGKYYICISKGSANIIREDAEETAGEGVSCALMEIDFEGSRISEAAGNLPDIRGICPGRRPSEEAIGQDGNSGRQYDFLLYDERAVYGFDLTAPKKITGSAGEELLIWMDSDINGYCVTNLYLPEDGKLCATVEDWDNEDRAIVMLERMKADEAPQREELVLVTVDGESDLAAMAVKFNRGNSRYHITVKNFESLTDLYNAVLAGEPMDLVDLAGVNVQKLAAQGFFEDLASYVEQSEAFGRSDFVDGLLDVYTFDNILVGIPASFTLQSVVGSREWQENRSGLTLEELLAASERYPKAHAFDGMTKDKMMQYLMMFNEDIFIDWNTGTCHFDSETFKAVLEYINQYPNFVEENAEELSLPAKIRNGEVLFAIAELNELRAFQEYEGMFGEDAACVGFPTPDGQGGHLLFTGDAYAITARSEHKEGAWKFIEGFLTQEKSEAYYRGQNSFFSTSFPTLKSTLNEKVEEAIEADSRYENDKFPELIYGDGSVFQYHALTWEEVNAILSLVPDAKPYFDVESDEIIQIISEEASGYYSGQREVGDVAGNIQNRVQLYVNENSR